MTRTRFFAAEAAQLGEAAHWRQTRLDWIAGMTAFKAVVLEGLEVVFIVIAVSAGRGLLSCRRGLGAPRRVRARSGGRRRSSTARPVRALPENTPEVRRRREWLSRLLAYSGPAEGLGVRMARS